MSDAPIDSNSRQGIIAASSVDGSTPVRVYANPSTHRLLVEATAGVSGPGSSTDNAIVRFDGTTGETIQNSTATISDAGLLNVAAFSVAGSAGADGTFTTVDAKTVTVVKGIITSIV